MSGWTRFETLLGDCAIAWSAQGVRACRLPGPRRDEDWVARFGAPCAPNDLAKQAIAGVEALLAQGHDGGLLLPLPLDDAQEPAFQRAVYALVRRIPPGQTLGYGEVAARLGQPGAARAVGVAMARNPFAPIVPCHRVLGAGGALTGFSAHGGVATKRRLLLLEREANPPPGQLF